MSFYVKRTRIQDRRAILQIGAATSEVGAIKYSKTFSTKTQAQREADAWAASEDWQVEILVGRAPR